MGVGEGRGGEGRGKAFSFQIFSELIINKVNTNCNLMFNSLHANAGIRVRYFIALVSQTRVTPRGG